MEFSLARISLKWMVQECFRTETGIRFCARRLEKFGLSSFTPSPLPLPFVESGPRVEYSYRRMSGATDVDKHVAASAGRVPLIWRFGNRPLISGTICRYCKHLRERNVEYERYLLVNVM